MRRKKILKFTLKCECVVSVIVNRPVLPLCVVDGRSRNPLYYYYYYYSILPRKNNGVIVPYTQWTTGGMPLVRNLTRMANTSLHIQKLLVNKPCYGLTPVDLCH